MSCSRGMAVACVLALGLGLGTLDRAPMRQGGGNPDRDREAGDYPSDWFWAQRAFPRAAIPEDRYQQALEQTRMQRALATGQRRTGLVAEDATLTQLPFVPRSAPAGPTTLGAGPDDGGALTKVLAVIRSARPRTLSAARRASAGAAAICAAEKAGEDQDAYHCSTGGKAAMRTRVIA